MFPRESKILSLLNCASWHLCALPIINTRLTCLRALLMINKRLTRYTQLSTYAPLLSSIGALWAFALSKLNFNNHINTIYRTSANQLKALIRLRRFLGIEERKALIQSFVLSNFIYGLLVWILSSVKSLNKIEKLQKRALRFRLSDCESSYDELLWLPSSCAINVRLKRNLCVEIDKTLNDLNPSFMREIFEIHKTKRAVCQTYKINLEIPRVNRASKLRSIPKLRV